MSTPERVPITEAQLGALTRGGLVRVPYGNRGTFEVYCTAQETRGGTATTDDGDEYTVVSFPDDVFDQMLDVVGADGDQDKVKVQEMIWVRASAVDVTSL